MEAYCVKCKTKREMGEDYEVKTSENGRKRAVGKCPTCGTTLNRFLKG